jgi:hypothetical protein
VPYDSGTKYACFSVSLREQPLEAIVVVNLLRNLAVALVLLIFSQSASAGVIPINLNEFSGSLIVVSPDGSTADILGETGTTSPSLYLDPFVDLILYPGVTPPPDLLIPAAGRSLVFEFEFDEAPDNQDLFFARLYESGTTITGLADSPVFDTSTSGTISFDLSPFVSYGPIGLDIYLLHFDTGYFECEGFSPGCWQSTASVSNMRLIDTAVPEPSTLALFGIGMLGMAASRRRKKV